MTPTDALSVAIRNRLLAGMPASLPGVGSLVCSRLPARIQTVPRGAQILLPPQETVVLGAETDSAPDLAAVFASALTSTPNDAESALRDQVALIQSALASNGAASIPGVGTLTRTAEGLAFDPEESLIQRVNGSYNGLTAVEPPAPPESPVEALNPPVSDALGAPVPPPIAVPELDRVLEDLLDEDSPTLQADEHVNGTSVAGESEAASSESGTSKSDTGWEQDTWSVPLPASASLGADDDARLEDAEFDVVAFPPVATLRMPAPSDARASDTHAKDELYAAPLYAAGTRLITPAAQPLKEPFDFARPMSLDREPGPSVANAPRRRMRAGAWIGVLVLPFLLAAAVIAWMGRSTPDAFLTETAQPPSDATGQMSITAADLLVVSDSVGLADIQYLPETPPVDSARIVSSDRAVGPLAVVAGPSAGTTTSRAGGGTPRAAAPRRAPAAAPPSSPRASISAPAAQPPATTRSAAPATAPAPAPSRNVGVAPPANTAILPPQLGGLSDNQKDELSGSAPIPLGDGYSWVVLSTPSRDEAAGVAGRFQTSGYRTRVTSTTKDGRLFFRVLIGHFGTRAEAFALRSRIAPQASGDTWLLDLGSN